MNSKTFVFIIFALVVSCRNNHPSILLAREEFVMQITKMYELDFLMDHFPKTRHNEIGKSNKWSASYYRCDDYPGYSNYRFVGDYNEEASVSLIDSIEKRDYKSIYLFSDSVLMKLDIPYLVLEKSFKRMEFDSLTIPIYNFQDTDFNLGKEEDSVFFNGRYWYGEHSVIPSDLIVYVIDAQSGNFWRNKELADKEPRPVLPQKWKHGYSRGIGVSRSCNRVCWWVMAW